MSALPIKQTTQLVFQRAFSIFQHWLTNALILMALMGMILFAGDQIGCFNRGLARMACLICGLTYILGITRSIGARNDRARFWLIALIGGVAIAIAGMCLTISSVHPLVRLAAVPVFLAGLHICFSGIGLSLRLDSSNSCRLNSGNSCRFLPPAA